MLVEVLNMRKKKQIQEFQEILLSKRRLASERHQCFETAWYREESTVNSGGLLHRKIQIVLSPRTKALYTSRLL